MLLLGRSSFRITTLLDGVHRVLERWRPSIVFAAYLVLSLWWVWPQPIMWARRAAFAPRGLDDLGQADFYLITWALSWVSHSLVTDPANVFNANTFFPAPLSLAFSESLLGYVPFFAPVYLTFRTFRTS